MIKNQLQSMMCTSLSSREFRRSAEENPEASQGDGSPIRKSERGVALLMVLILSAVSLMLVAALLYMITIGTRASGMQKRYRNALEAGIAGSDITNIVIGLRGDNTAISNFISNSLGGSLNISPNCSGTVYSSGTGSVVYGVAAKILSSSTTWNNNCGTTSLSADPTNYDFTFPLGTSPQFKVYAKIVNVVEGNTSNAGTAGSGHQLVTSPVVGNSNEIPTPTIPYQYTIEIDAENAASDSGSRAKLSVLYQY